VKERREPEPLCATPADQLSETDAATEKRNADGAEVEPSAFQDRGVATPTAYSPSRRIARFGGHFNDQRVEVSAAPPRLEEVGEGVD